MPRALPSPTKLPAGYQYTMTVYEAPDYRVRTLSATVAWKTWLEMEQGRLRRKGMKSLIVARADGQIALAIVQ